MSKSPSLRRIQADVRELAIDPSDQYHAAPLESDMFEWHFTIRGAADTEFEGGVYHGRILLPPEYPFKPPHIVFLTPSGRFETHTKVCLSFSAHHPELWQPAWGIRLILEALISFLPTPADGAIGALDWTKDERKKLANESVKFRCPMCCADGTTCVNLLPEVKPASSKEGDDDDGNDKKKTPKTKFQQEIEKLKMLQFQNHAVEEEESKGEQSKEGDSSQKQPVEEVADGKAETMVQHGDEMQQPRMTATASNEISGDQKPPAASLQQLETITTEDNAKSTKGDNANIAQPNACSQSTSQQTATMASADKNEASTLEKKSNETITAPARNTPHSPVPAVADNGLRTTTQPAPTTQPAAAGANNVMPLVSDNFLNGMIAALAVVVVVLFRKAQSLMDEMRSLEES